MAALPTEIRRILDHVRRDVRRGALWQPGQTVLLACSGGRDSMAALAILDALRPSLGHTLVVGHVDHGLQADHAEVAALVVAEAQRRGLAVQTRALQLRTGADLEARARDGRYRALQAIAQELGATAIATAHHADDQAETVLLRLARGAGPDAWTGIRRQRDDGVVRPFLTVTRAQLAQCAEAFQVPWRDDPSNSDLAFSRNQVRHAVLPVLERALPGAAAGLARSARLAAEHEGALAVWLDRALAGVWQIDPARGEVTVPVAAIPAHPAAQSALMFRVFQHLGVAAPSQRAIDQWLAVGRQGDVRVHGVRIVGDGVVWRFLRDNIARSTPAD